jgi:hypothetical protein
VDRGPWTVARGQKKRPEHLEMLGPYVCDVAE